MDRRIRKTRAALIDGFARLLADHDLAAISVQKICDAANVARSSFYVHFNNKRELVTAALAALEADLLNGQDPNYAGRFAFLPGLLAHIEIRKSRGKARSRFLLEPGMLDEFRRFVLRLVERSLQAGGGPSDQLLLAYIGGGVLAAIQAWLDGGCREPAKLLAQRIETMTSRNWP